MIFLNLSQNVSTAKQPRKVIFTEKQETLGRILPDFQAVGFNDHQLLKRKSSNLIRTLEKVHEGVIQAPE